MEQRQYRSKTDIARLQRLQRNLDEEVAVLGRTVNGVLREEDVNRAVAEAVCRATGSSTAKGEDLIGDPKLRAAFKEAKKRAANKG